MDEQTKKEFFSRLTVNDIQDIKDTATWRSMYQTSSTAIETAREVAAKEARYAIDRAFPPELRDFLFWLIENDPHINAKLKAFRACKRIGAGVYSSAYSGKGMK